MNDNERELIIGYNLASGLWIDVDCALIMMLLAIISGHNLCTQVPLQIGVRATTAIHIS